VVAPLKLKRQKSAVVKSAKQDQAINNPLAKVLVNTPVSFLEDIYDYLVPESLTELVTVGSVVKIEYGHVKTEGLVVERTSGGSSKLKNIEDLLGWPGMIKPEVIEHLQKVQARFGGSFWNLLDSYLPAIPGKLSESNEFSPPPYSGKSGDFFEKLISPSDLKSISADDGIRYSVNQPVGFKPYEILFELISMRVSKGQVLVIASDFREFDYLQSELQNRYNESFQSYDTRKGKKERFLDFEVINKAEPRVILGNRSSSFLPLAKNSSIFVVNDCDHSHYEMRSPGWNSRDVSLLRDSDTSLFFYSATPSYEIERLVELNWIKKLNIKNDSKIQYFVSNGGDSYIPVIKGALDNGNVLVSVAAKGYANIFLCSKCRNPANCKCGGRLRVKSANTNPSCYLCNEEYKNWKCTECGESKPFVISKGLDRTAEEIARAIPSAQVIKTTIDTSTGDLPEKGQVIVSSRGAEPITNFSAVILLDGEKLFNQPTLRAEEMLKHTWFDLMSRVLDKGSIYISLLNKHPLTQQLLLKQSSSLTGLQNRKEAKLPPFYRICQVTGNLGALSAFADNLRKSNIYIFSGVTSINSDLGNLIIRVDVDHGQDLVEIMQDIVKMQGVKGKPLFEYRFDQYDL
jgi:primosomal protein N' (replication factor Y)